jgi:hypothetical protein
MPYQKTIVCLANSRKEYPNRCVAGKEKAEQGFGRWIRPVSDLAKGDLTSQHRCYSDGTDPRLLDVVTIQFLGPRPQGCQKENHRIDSSVRWVKVGGIGWNELAPAIDKVAGELWRNGDSSSNGLNDRIPEKVAEQLPSSLLLIEPEAFEISVAKEGGVFKPARKKVRGRFQLNGHEYLLAVTDLPVEDQYAKKDEGDYPIQGARLCISIGEPYHGYCYKLIAAVITQDRAHN